MPAYSATREIIAIYPGDERTVWSAESPATGAKSDRVAIGGLDVTSVGGPGGLSAQIKFSADPGVFAIDVQTADEDIDGAYATVVSAQLTAVNASFYGRIELWPIQAKFARLIMTDDPANAVTVTAKIGR